MTETAQRMMALFAGARDAHGTYKHEDQPARAGKIEIKTSARTIREPVTEELWDEHLAGKRPLGIIPIDEDNNSWWGVIDVDKYDLSHAELADRVAKRKLPLIMTKSKSGGAHLFLFLTSPIPAAEMKAHLRNISAQLGLGDCEVFPKQSQVLREQGDLGNWLNMPYFGDTRRGVKRTGAEMTIREFLAVAESARISKSQLGSTEPASADDSFTDGPPCLQHLTATGFPEGTRNNGLFGLGVFVKKKFGEKWQEMLEEYNRRYMKPPLSSEEVSIIIKSLEKKEYNYKCGDVPLVTHCNSALCRTRRFGVGEPGALPLISGLSVLTSDPPVWFMDIEDHRIEMSTDDLQQYKKFHKICMERLLVCYKAISQDAWLRMVSTVMANVTTIEASPDVGMAGMFQEILEDFCTNKQRGERIEDILAGRPWHDQESGRHYFQLRDLERELERQQMRGQSRGQITQRIRDLGGGHRGLNVKGKFRNLWWVPADAVQAIPHVDPPPVRGEEI